MEPLQPSENQHAPKPVWELLKSMGVGPVAVDWARPFGTDLRRMWGECAHGELMIGIAAQTMAPSMLTTLAALECVDSSLPEGEVMPVEVVRALETIEGWLVEDAEDGDVAECVGGLDIAIRHFANGEDDVSVRACQAAQCLGLSIMHSDHRCPERRQALVTALKQSSQLRIAIVQRHGETNDHVLRNVGLAALREFAQAVRFYVPIEVVTMAGFYHASADITALGFA